MQNTTIINKSGLYIICKGLQRSKWMQGVREYALELIETLPDDWEYSNDNLLEQELLNGADNWNAYSWGGCSFCYNEDICERLATPSEQKRTKGGQLRPNSREEWLDTQARALFQACEFIKARIHDWTE